MNLDLSNIPIEVMDTPNKKMMGMMGRDHLDGAMVFPFDEVGEKSFWMKNCLIKLDIIFIVGNKITKIYSSCPPCEKNYCEKYIGLGDKVLELNGGMANNLKLGIGDKIDFTDLP